MIKRISRTGLVNEVNVWTDFSNESLTLSYSTDNSDKDAAFQLAKEYDSFEKIVINKLDIN